MAASPPIPSELSPPRPVTRATRDGSLRPKQRNGVLLVALVGLLAWLLLPPLHHLAYDLGYLLKRPESPDELVIVTMDPQSHVELGQSPDGRWSRSLHGALIDRLQSMGPAAIVLDVIFNEAGVQGAQADVDLTEAARRSGKVAVAADLFAAQAPGAIGTEFRPPFEPLRSVTRWGTTRWPQNSVIRESVPRVAGWPTLARTVLDMLPTTNGSGTAAAESRFWLRYYGPPGSLPRVSYASVLRGTVAPDRIRDRIVLVGVDYPGPYPAAGAWTSHRGLDTFPTPYTRFTGHPSAGVEVLATEILNLRRGDALRRLPWWFECGLVLLFAPLVMGLIPGAHSLRAVGMAALAVLVVAAVGVGSVWPTGVWFPWTIPAFIQVPGALVWSLLAQLDHARTSARHSPTEPPHPVQPAPGAPSPRRGVAHPAVLAIPDYALLKEIGQGAYGSVWLARDALGTLRAVKVVQRASFSDRAPYDREFEGIRRYTPLSLKHPGFTPILHVGRDEAHGFFYYVMEAADDQNSGPRIPPENYTPRTLASELQRRQTLPLAEVREIGLALTRALTILHENGFVHRDLKPENILFLGGNPRLGDPGLVAPRADQPGVVSQVGTPNYLPAEGPGTIAADVFALGKTLYVAWSGRPASKFPELPTDFHLRPDAPASKQLNEILLTACDPDPHRRYPSMPSFLAALQAIS
ncbi:MAG: CHASE2 domain-containing protein [Verrucomicrobiales bacterium]|nr:CHASE2 domain-containing protein [Verrucomicrobiales bacterium]